MLVRVAFHPVLDFKSFCKTFCFSIYIPFCVFGCFFLNDIIADVSRKTEVNQWRSTATVINWFKNLSDKHKRKFIKFDIAELYPSISENLLNKSIVYANFFTNIEDNVFNAIKLARKSLIFNKDGTWVKKGDDTLFGVTMGNFDGAEICELVGLYLFDKLSSLIGRENVELLKDDGLAAINSSSGHVLDKMRKNIIALLSNIITNYYQQQKM